jgi:hypothetical protein
VVKIEQRGIAEYDCLMTDAVADPCGVEKQGGLSAPARAGAVFLATSELARIALFAQRFRQQFFLRL